MDNINTKRNVRVKRKGKSLRNIRPRSVGTKSSAGVSTSVMEVYMRYLGVAEHT